MALPRYGFPVTLIVLHIADCTGDLYQGFKSDGLSSNAWNPQRAELVEYVPYDRAPYTEGIITPGSDFPPAFVAAAGRPPQISDGWIANCIADTMEHEGKPFVDLSEGYGCLTAEQFGRTRDWVRERATARGLAITRDTVVGHSRFDHVNRINCPGPLFPWSQLFAAWGVA